MPLRMCIWCGMPGQRAAALLLALTFCLLLSLVRGADSPFKGYTAVQQMNTLKFLQAFVDANPLLEKLPSGDFCEWVYTSCTTKGVDLYLDETAVVQLPDIPSDVVVGQVRVTSISLSFGKGVLKGTLPASWGGLSRIEYISLYSNSLTGTLPPEWSNMKTAKWLLLNDNELTGTIPDSWGELRYMTWACLNDNRLTGLLPSSWGSAPRLTIIDARGNQLSGTLPPAWSRLRFINSITLSNNHLTGPLPVSWASSPSLNGVFLQGNNLCGCVPQEWKSHTFLYGIKVDESLLAANCSSANVCRRSRAHGKA
ncbi:hypothetical protein LSCM1_01448 [Leishmania martiniquensis]|uniref:Surface membrane protein gp46-like protein n=1 Tax=Leishmania martiniquensis TaxID=1580590 RepID=A0A836KCJ6_9TRYP|nr:hypothetical protein LSCM1_01448 [Leishmania martiniquensis]